MEARAGEHNIAHHDSESARQLQALVKKLPKVAKEEAKPATGDGPELPHANQIKESTSATLPMPQVTPKPTKPRVGQRAPERDPVGNTSSAQKAVGRSFTEVTTVTCSQAEEASVSRFECPICLAMRTIALTGEYVKFPWHPKRITATPNYGLRWVKREAWQLSDQ